MNRVGHKLLLLLLAACAALPLSCQRETGDTTPAPNRTLSLPLLLEETPHTRVDVSGTTGKATWTEGDRIGLYVIDSHGINSGYRAVDVDCQAQKVTFSLNPDEEPGGYAIYPYSAIYGGDPDPAGDGPMVIYAASYDLTGQTPETYAPTPMVAVNGGETLAFYHAGGLLRLELNALPAGTERIEVIFPELEHVAGIYAVSHPATARALTDVNAPVAGYGNTITLTGFTYAASLTVNIPLPSGDYSALQSLRIRAYDGSDALVGAVSKAVQRDVPSYNWGVLDHGFGRQLPVDFSAGGLLDFVRLNADTPVTLWKSQSITRTAKAYYADGRVYSDMTVSWESADPAIASVESSTGIVTGVSPGQTTITATATPNVGGASKTASFTVYVNAVTDFTLAAASGIVDKNGGSTILTATLTHTDNGTILAYPADMMESWTSSEETFVILSHAALRPAAASSTTATVTAVATGAAYGGLSTITATLSYRYTHTVTNFTRTCQVRSKTKTTCVTTVPTFRGYTISRGFLERADDSTWTLSDGSNPFEIVAFQTGGQEYVSYPVHYNSWMAMADYFDGILRPSTIQHLLHKIHYAGGVWVLPTGDDWAAIIATDDPDAGALVTNDTGELAGRKHYAKVSVDMTGSPYEGVTAWSGVVLFPDDAVITASGLVDFDNPTGSYSNSVSYEDIMTLAGGGCLFLCNTGCRNNQSYGYMDYMFLSSNVRGQLLKANGSSFGMGSYFDPDVYTYPTRLIRE